ncbi:MAG: NACHT domain-containing protein [Candidatus Electrothrix sp. Rat3]|nr:NACHT domain-containing protein [Candidatus Electrothrix rattekaaiensis]
MTWTEIIAGLHWLKDHPEVTWSGAGFTLLGILFLVVKILVVKTPLAVLIRRLLGKPPLPPSGDTNDWFSRNRHKFIERLKTDLKDRRESFLLGQNTLDLDKELSPDAVDRPYCRQDSIEYSLERDGTEVETTDQPITALFQQPEVGQRLAILGKPGSGKTVCLLKLVEHLLEQASEDTGKPLPIIFECSEWDGRELLPWMAWQLNRKYEINEKTALQMVEERDILPLFDGLDELAAEKQGDFVRLFNALPNDRPQVVCCRVKEYGQLQKNSKVKLALKNAVILRDISRPRLKGHLLRQGLDELWNMLEQSENEADLSLSSPVEGEQEGEQPQSLLELARRPLFLGIMIGVAEKLRKGFRRQEGESWEDLLWRLYLNDCLSPRTPPPNQGPDEHDRKYAQAPSRHWLHCLARWMQAEDKVALQLDELQPTMLPRYWLFGFFYGLFYGLTSGLVIGFLIGPISGAALGLAMGLFFGQPWKRKIRIDHLHPLHLPVSWQDWQDISATLLTGLAVGLFLGLPFRLLDAKGIGLGRFAIAFWLTFGILGGLALGLQIVARPLKKIIKPQQRLNDALFSSLVLFPFFVLTPMLLFVWVMSNGEQLGSTLGIFSGMKEFYVVLLATIISSFRVLGTNQILQHYLLRLCLRLEQQLPLRLVPWLNAMHQRKVFQRVGGSYHFLHKQLRDYLAMQDTTS